MRLVPESADPQTRHPFPKHNRRSVTADAALILARVFGNSADFWLNVQRRNDLWMVMNTPAERARIHRAKPLPSAA